MDYEKAYKEALERAKVFINSSKSENWSKKTARAIFPELRESDDEKIRKELLEHVKYCSESIPERAAMIAWLEKQGQTFTKKDVDDAYLKGISDAKNELEKQGEPTDIPVDAVLDSNKDGLIADTIKYKNEQKPVE